MSRSQRLFFQVFLRLVILVGCFLISSEAMAVTALSLAAIKGTVAQSLQNVLSMVQDVAMVSGTGFVLSSFFKFHQHKMNPTQVPMSQGVAMLAIGSALLVFPHVLGTVSKSAFGQSAGSSQSISGVIKST